MDSRIEKILTNWHQHFSNEDKQYSEFESSDIEYFVGCLLYNSFAFSKALDTLKTMDLSYDFIGECGDEYDEHMAIVSSIDFTTEEEKLEFLQSYIREAKEKYTEPELYLLNRLEFHVDAMAVRYSQNVNAAPIDFKNPLYR